jgi:hypothetical protein
MLQKIFLKQLIQWASLRRGLHATSVEGGRRGWGSPSSCFHTMCSNFVCIPCHYYSYPLQIKSNHINYALTVSFIDFNEKRKGPNIWGPTFTLSMPWLQFEYRSHEAIQVLWMMRNAIVSGRHSFASFFVVKNNRILGFQRNALPKQLCMYVYIYLKRECFELLARV